MSSPMQLPGLIFAQRSTIFALFRAAIQIRAIRHGKRHPRTAFVGADDEMLAGLEALQELVMDHSVLDPDLMPESDAADWRIGFQLFEGRVGDRDRPSRPLSMLNTDEFDLIVIGDEPMREANLTSQIAMRIRPKDRPVKMLRFSHLRDAFCNVIFSLHESTYRTTLNPLKIACVVACYDMGLFAPGGAILESGTFMGGTTILMGALARLWGENRLVHGFDSFAGIPQATARDGTTVFGGGQFAEASLQHVQACVDACQLGATVRLHQGLVEQTLPAFCSQVDSVAFAFADTDQYSGTIASLMSIAPKLHPLGVILVDDYFEHGVRRAVSEALSRFPHLRGALVSHSMFLIWHA